MANLRVYIIAADDTANELKAQLGELNFVDIAGCASNTTSPPMMIDVVLVDMGEDANKGQEIISKLDALNPAPMIVALHEDMDAEIILSAIRSGADEFVQYPQDSGSIERILSQQFQRLIKTREQDAKHNKSLSGQIISLFSPKGGGGSSIIAINLAEQLLQKTGQRVIVIDANPQYNTLGNQLNLEFRYGINDMDLGDGADVENALLEKLTLSHDNGLKTMVCCNDVTSDSVPPTDEQWEAILNTLKQHYDWIIVDCPSQVVDGFHQVINQLGSVNLLVSMMDLPSLSRTRQYLDLAKKYLNLENTKLLLNRYNLASVTNISYQKLEDAFHYPVFSRLSNDWQTCIDSTSLGQFLSETKGNSPLAKDIQKLAERLTGDDDEQNGTTDGLLAKLKQLVK